MPHYEERLERDLGAIREAIEVVATGIDQALKESVAALMAGDRERAYAVALGDLAINRRVREIDRRCHAFVARHLPSAGHLRTISATLRLTVELERVGDYAVSIGRESVQLSEPPPARLGRDIERMAEQTGQLLHRAVRSFLDGDAELARSTKEAVYKVEQEHAGIFDDLVEAAEQQRRTARDLFALEVVYSRLSRVADQAKNVCEDTLFAVTGEIKPPRAYKVLFVDERNECASQMAEAIARKAFPRSGRYTSAGWNPGDVVPLAVRRFLERKGHDIDAMVASSLATAEFDLVDYDVIVSINGDVDPHLPERPFHTIILQWRVEECAAGFTGEGGDDRLEVAYRDLTGRVADLLHALHGEDAD